VLVDEIGGREHERLADHVGVPQVTTTKPSPRRPVARSITASTRM
jgi:hypothetical protein